MKKKIVLKKLNSQIFNGAKFRLHGFVVPDRNGEGSRILKMGLTSYKEMVGTHYAPDREELISSARERGLGNVDKYQIDPANRPATPQLYHTG